MRKRRETLPGVPPGKEPRIASIRWWVQLDSLLEALESNSFSGAEVPSPTITDPETPVAEAPLASSAPTPPSSRLPVDPPPAVNPVGVAPEPSPVEAPEATGVSPNPRDRTRRLAIIATVVVVATGIAYLVGSTLGGLVDGGGPSVGQLATENSGELEIVSHRFAGDGTTTSDWFNPITEFRAVWTEVPTGDVTVTLEDDTETVVTITPEVDGAERVFIPAGTYRLTVRTDGPWALDLVRVLDG